MTTCYQDSHVIHNLNSTCDCGKLENKFCCKRCGKEKLVGPFGSACPSCPEDKFEREKCGICGVPRWQCCC